MAETKASVKARFVTGSKPTQGDFEALVEAYQDRDATLDAMAAASAATGFLEVIATAEATLRSAGTLGEALFYTGTAASGRTELGAGTAGAAIFQIETPASVAAYVSALNDPTTTEGDFIVRTSAGLDRLAIGADGTFMVVDVDEPKWEAAASARNLLGLATVGQAEAEAGTATTERAWTAERVKQAIDALATSGGITRGTVQASTSGSSINFTGIAAGANRITIMLDGVSASGDVNAEVRIGDSGGLEATGYTSAGTTSTFTTTSTTGFLLRFAYATRAYSGHIVLERVDGNDWVASHVLGDTSGSYSIYGGGSKTLSAELDRLSIVVASGTFDAGQINIFVE